MRPYPGHKKARVRLVEFDPSAAAGEEMVAGTERWTPSEHGAFLYMMGGAQCR